VSNGLAREGLPTVNAANLIEATVEIYNPERSCLVVKRVDVLGNHSAKERRLLCPRDSVMPPVWLRSGETRPPHVASQPIALTMTMGLQKVTKAHGVLLGSTLASVVRNTRISGDSGPSQHGSFAAPHHGDCFVDGAVFNGYQSGRYLHRQLS
jgi:hypothetical protein